MEKLVEPGSASLWDADPRGSGAKGGKPPRGPIRWGRWLKRLSIGLVVLLVLAAVAVAWASWKLPVSRALEPLPHPALVLLSADGKPIARRGEYKDTPVEVATLPAYVPAAFVAIEDRRFYRHFGLDVIGIGRAAAANMREGHVRQGGSTITQQLAKTSFLTSKRTFRRKVQEAFIALWLEARLSKDEILARYLSSVYFGDGVFGLRAAAHNYFGKPPEKLTLGEAAMLAGLVKAPSALNPVDHPAEARARQKVVLAAMVDTKAITPAEAAQAGRVRIVPQDPLPVGGYFADWAASQVKLTFDPAYGEVRARTTLDSRLQARAERAVRNVLARSGARLEAGQAALVAMRRDGSVVAMVGGKSYAASQFNRATQAKRQPGSAFKLFVYLAALRDGLEPDTIVSEAPIKVGGWAPKNFAGESGRLLTLRDAFAVSSNIAAVRLSEGVGRGRVEKAARDLGVTSPLNDDATMALGTSEMTLLELTSAYAGVASGDMPVTPHAIVDPDRAGPQPEPMDPREHDGMLDLLEAAVVEGTGHAAGVGQPVYGKTGTAQDHRDAVFVGFTGDIVVGVWVGNDDHSPMKGVTGGGLPAEIWREFTYGAIAAGLVERVRAEPPPPPEPPAPETFGDRLKHFFGSLFGR